MTDILDATDLPSKLDYKFSTLEEVYNGENSKRPTDKLIVQNQGTSKGCTMYSATHIVNANNIIEDISLWENRPQVDPMIRWELFCKERWYSNQGSNIQTMAQRNKQKWYIAGWVTCDKSGDELVKQMKKALDMWYFISTGSSNGDWTKTKKTGIYTIRTDNKFVWHARAIVDYKDDYFIAINSYGKRWKYNGYFRVPFTMVDKIYSKLCIIDANDKNLFVTVAEKEKAKQIITLAKELHKIGTLEQQQYFEKIQLSTNLTKLYSI